MKTKMFTRVMALLMCLCLFASCGASGNLEKAVCEQCSQKPFAKFMEDAIRGEMEENGMEVEYKVSWKEGWDDSEDLDEGALSKGNKAATYTLRIEQEDGRVAEMSFFMELDPKENTLEPQGIRISASDNGEIVQEEEAGKAEAEASLESMAQSAEYLN